MVVPVEVAPEGRDPLEAPAHAPFESLQLGLWRTRHRNHGHVAVGQMNNRRVVVVGNEGTRFASFGPFGIEHEVVSDELAFAVEELRQSFLSTGSVERVFLFNFFPGEIPAPPTQFVTETAETPCP